MNWRIEQEVKQGSVPKLGKDDLEVTHATDESGEPAKKMLEAGIAAATALTDAVPGTTHVTIDGHESKAKGTHPAHVTVTVSRLLSDDSND